MKKVLLATAIAAVSTTAAMADVSISDYQEGKAHALMQAANSFEARGINIVENSNKLAVHKTINAWNQGFNALEGNNEVDLSASVLVTTLYTHSQGAVAVENSNITHNGDGSATIVTGEGISYVIEGSDVYYTHTETVSLRDSRADTVRVRYGSATTQFDIGSETDISNTVLALKGADSWDVLIDKVEGGIQAAYDVGFEDGYTAGYDDGFAAAKGVVKN